MKNLLKISIVMCTILILLTGCEQKSKERKQCENFIKALGGSAEEAAEECSEY